MTDMLMFYKSFVCGASETVLQSCELFNDDVLRNGYFALNDTMPVKLLVPFRCMFVMRCRDSQ